MAGRRKTKRSRTSSSGVDDHLKNVNDSENFVGPTTNDPEIQRVFK